MADLAGGRDERGQLLLIAALVLAAAFIVLALVINSAIFTENLATRPDVAGSEDALEHRAEVADVTGDIVTAVNTEDPAATASSLRSQVQDETATLSGLSGRQQAGLGRVADVEYRSDTVGERIAQDDANRTLTDNDGNESWTLAQAVGEVRDVQFEFHEIDTSPGVSDDPFRLRLEGGGNTWELAISSEGGIIGPIDADEIEFAVRSDTAGARCVRDESALADGLTVDVTGATIAGEPCHALDRLQSDGSTLWLGANVGSYDRIEFENADNVNGTYSMVIDAEQANRNSLNSGADPDDPYFATALYSVTLQYGYYTHAVAYETNIRVAPGEVPP